MDFALIEHEDEAMIERHNVQTQLRFGRADLGLYVWSLVLGQSMALPIDGSSQPGEGIQQAASATDARPRMPRV